MSKAKKKAPKNTQELRFRLAELYNDLENGDIELATGKAMVGAASAYINSLRTDLVNMQITGKVKQIDELHNDYKDIGTGKPGLSIAEVANKS